MFNGDFKKAVSQANGFSYSLAPKTKWAAGFSAHKAGASLLINFDSTTGMRGGWNGHVPIPQAIGLAFLKRPSGMGHIGESSGQLSALCLKQQ